MSINKSEINDNHVYFYGKIAKFPKNTKAHNAHAFLENIKIPRNKIWYLIVEQQENELQMVKYNRVEGVNLIDFVNELKKYYLDLYKGNDEMCEKINNIFVFGENKFSIIKNIPRIEVDGKQLITKITEDLITLLAG
jgi:hypothetical protein